MQKEEKDRVRAIERYLKGESLGAIATSLGYSRRWVYKWVERFESTEELSDEPSQWYESRSSRPRQSPKQATREIVETVKLFRLHLYNQNAFCGAQAIRWEMEEEGVTPLPSLRTINRILDREGLTHQRTGHYEPKGKAYPALAAEEANQVHQMDYVGPCYLKGPLRFYSLHCIDLATRRVAVNPVLSKAGQHTVDAIWSSWCRLGIPDHQQVDNEAVFYGSRRHPRGMGNLIRLCLEVEVEPWFIPMAEPWRNGVVEKFNDHYQQLFLAKVAMQGEADLRRESLTFEEKHNSRYRYSKLNGRTPQGALARSQRAIRFPESTAAPLCPLPKPESGRYHAVRFIRSDGVLDLFGDRFNLGPDAAYEYAIATVDVGKQKLSVEIGGCVIDEFDYTLR